MARAAGKPGNPGRRERRGKAGNPGAWGKPGMRGRPRMERRAGDAGEGGRMRGVVGRVLFVALALAVCTVPIVFVNDVIGYIPLLALVLVMLVSFAYLQVLKRSLEFSEESLLPSCERGTDIEFVLLFKNRSPLVFTRLEPHIYISDLFGGVDAVTRALMTLMPFEERDFRFEARFDHIGTYTAGVQKIVINDLLGLFSYTVVNESHHQVNVMPRLFDVSRVDLTTVSSEESQRAFQAQVSDDMDYAGVRDYEWGDPLKAIHWKLSAAIPDGNYLTRLYETYNDPGITIVVDPTSPDYDADSLMFIYDSVVECALSVNDFARQRGLDSVVMFRDQHGQQASLRVLSVNEFHNLTARLPRIEVGDGAEALDLLRQEGNRLHARDNIAFCTAHASEPIVSALIEIKNRKRNPMLLLAVPPAMEPEERKELTRPLRRLDSAHIVYYVVSSAKDLQEKAAIA